MWTVLDVLLLGSTISAHQPPWLPLGYTIGAFMVTVALFVRGTWQWSSKETWCAIGAGITAFLWLTLGALAGILAGITAMTLAGMPLWIDMYRNPVRATWPLWTITVVACLLTLLGSDWSLSGIALALGGILFNGSIAYLVLFRKPKALVSGVPV
jgi:hypothetical protein